MNVVVGMSMAAGVVLAALLLVVWRLWVSARVQGVDSEWLSRFSVERYRPMERLLSEDDVRFLKSEPGYEPRMEKTLRAERRRIFRSYLNGLARDFNRLHLALRLMVLHAPEDRSDLAVVLIRQKALFFVGLTMAHLRLSLYALGIGTVDVRGLLSVLETMRFELNSLAPARSAAV